MNNVRNKAVSGAKFVQKTANSGAKFSGSVFQDFKDFINKGNVVDLAVAVVMGAAFTSYIISSFPNYLPYFSIVTSLVKDILTPFISLAGTKNLENDFLFLRKPDACENNGTLCATIALAQAQGAVTWNWGNFLNTLINFFIVSLIIFFVVKAYGFSRRSKNVALETEKECPDCCKMVPIKARKCFMCQSPLPMPRETDTIVELKTQ